MSHMEMNYQWKSKKPKGILYLQFLPQRTLSVCSHNPLVFSYSSKGTKAYSPSLMKMRVQATFHFPSCHIHLTLVVLKYMGHSVMS